MSNGSSTPSSFKRIFVGEDAAYAGQVVASDIFQVAGLYGPILRVGSTPTEDYVIWTGTANTSFGEIDVGANLDNYFTISGAASGSSPLISAVGTTDANVGIGLLPEGDYMTTTTRMLIGPQSSWAAAQTSNATRLRTQLAAFHTSFVHTSGQEFYPQFSVTGGSQSGTVDAGKRHGHSVMSIDNDNLVTVAGGSGPEGLSMLYIGLGAGNANGAAGGAHAGGRTAIDANIFVNSDVDVRAGTIFHVALAGNTTAYRRMGGVPGSHRGNVFGSLLAARGQNLGGTGPGPRYLNSIVGLEVDVEQQANVSALWKMAAQIVEEKDSAANALQQNIGLLFANQPSATTIGWNQGISFGGYNGQWPIASNGQVIATLPTPIGISTFDAADGLNLRRVTFSRAAIETPGLYVDGSGNLGGQTVGGLALQTVSAINAKVSTVSSVTVVEGGVFDGPTLISTTGTYSSGSTAVTVASFAGISNGMIIAGTDFTPGTTVVSGAGTVNLVVSANTLGAGTGAAVTFVTANPKPTFTIASPATSGGVSGTTATMAVVTMGAVGFTGISTGGNGLYVAGETLTAVGGTGTAFTVYIETVTAGTPTNIRVASAGSYTVLPTNPVSFTGSAAGTGFTLGMRWTILTVSNTAGTNYNELRPPVVTFTGLMTQTREARFKLAMSAGTSTTLVLNEGATTEATLGTAGSFKIVGNFNGTGTIKTTTFNYNDSGQTAELQLINTLSGGNSIAVRNMATDGYSAYIVRDSSGIERMALGIGNSTSGLPNQVYWEGSYFTGASHTTVPPVMKIIQTGYMFGAYGQYTRINLTTDGKIQFFQDDGATTGFLYDSVASAAAINPALSTATVGASLDVFGAGLFGDTSGSRTNAMTGTPAIGINHANGVFLRAIYPNIGTAVVQMTGNTTTRGLEFVNTDNSSLVMVRMALNGTGQVTFGGPIIRKIATGLTAAGTMQSDALALTAERNYLSTVAAATGVKLPTAIAGMEIRVINRGANTVNVYPASGAQIDALGTDVATTIAANGRATFGASTTTQWYTEA